MSQALFYSIWVSVIIVFYIFYAYMSHKNNTDGGGWVYAIWLSGLFPGWALVSKYSKNILFDGMLYDAIMFLSYTIALGFLTNKFYTFNMGQWVGLVLAVTGFFVLKYYS